MCKIVNKKNENLFIIRKDSIQINFLFFFCTTFYNYYILQYKLEEL